MHNLSNKSRFFFTIVVLVVLGLLVYGVVFLRNAFLTSPLLSFNNDSYYAVFLTNNQVYFGKLSQHNRAFLDITDVYYLQIDTVLQAAKPAEASSDADGNTTEPELSLVKLGNEIHGPKSSMTINKEHVLFFEELKDDSKVVQAIKNQKVQ